MTRQYESNVRNALGTEQASRQLMQQIYVCDLNCGIKKCACVLLTQDEEYRSDYALNMTQNNHTVGDCDEEVTPE